MEQTVHVGGNNVRYIRSGSASRVLVLVHGLGASAERWERVIAAFSEEFTVIVPDLVGFGRSDKPLMDYTQEFFAGFLAEFLDVLGISSPYLVGSSLGGQICAEYAAGHGRVERMVLVAPSGIMKHSTPALDAYVMAALYPNGVNARQAFEMMSGPDKEVDSRIIDGFVDRMRLPNAKQAFMSTLLGLKNSEVITGRLARIRVPTLIVWGEYDPVIPISYAKEFVAAIKDCRFYMIESAGHTPYVEHPAEFARIVRDFLGRKE